MSDPENGVNPTETTLWMLVERTAFEEVRGGEYGEVTDYDVVSARHWPNAQWISEARRVVQTVDEESCALALIVDDATGQMCSNPIGWVLYEDDDEPQRSGVHFRSFVLVGVSNDHVVAVCEDCGPESMYEAAYLGRQARLDQIEEQRRKVAEKG